MEIKYKATTFAYLGLCFRVFRYIVLIMSLAFTVIHIKSDIMDNVVMFLAYVVVFSACTAGCALILNFYYMLKHKQHGEYITLTANENGIVEKIGDREIVNINFKTIKSYKLTDYYAQIRYKNEKNMTVTWSVSYDEIGYENLDNLQKFIKNNISIDK